MAITQAVHAILIAPFESHQHEFIRDYIYIEETAVLERVELVDLSFSSTEPHADRNDNNREIAAVSATMTICGVTRGAIGGQSFAMPKRYKDEKDDAYLLRVESEFRKAELEKGGHTDWLKRVGRHFGIGRYLLQCPKDVTEHGPKLDAWLKRVAEEQSWSPQYFEARCFRVLGLVREDLIAAAKASAAKAEKEKTFDSWKSMTYPQKFDVLTEMVAARAAQPATFTA